MEYSRRCFTMRGMAVFSHLALMTSAGCSQKPTVPRGAFQYSRHWRVSWEQQKVDLVAKLQPEALKADKPAMLEVRMRVIDASKPFTGRIWYRFAHRRGDPSPFEMDLAVRPPNANKEDAPPHYDHWFAWAEIVEPRIEHGDAVFSTPVMFAEGKCYVQLRVALAPDLEPQELLDWSIYVDEAD